MRHLLLPTTADTMASSSSSSSAFQSASKPYKKTTIIDSLKPSNCPSANSLRKHSPSATLDLLILLLVLFSAAFLIVSYLSYLFHSLSLILPSISFYTILSEFHPESIFYSSLAFSVILVLVFLKVFRRPRSHKCGNDDCIGLTNAMEYDLQFQDDDCLRMGKSNDAVRAIDKLPWKGGTEFNSDYECLRDQLRKIAPVNGRAVLIFRSKCGCPFAKLEGWGPKRGTVSRRPKKLL